MKHLTGTIVSLFNDRFALSAGRAAGPAPFTPDDLWQVKTVAPALEKYARGTLGDVWKRPASRRVTAASSRWRR